jgi:hypothetical protein
MSDVYVECQKGWEKLYGSLFQLCKLLNIEVLQVKEKFGGLRFYVGAVPPEYLSMVYAIIEAVEAQSFRVCETCGTRNGVTTAGSWVLTLCQECREKRDERL